MPYIRAKGKNIYYEIHGEGEPLVLLNGIMMSTKSWAPFIDVFSSQVKLVLVDLVDQGKSDKGAGAYSQEFHAEVMAEILPALGCPRVHLLGVSYGGQVALLCALRNPDLLYSLILAGTSSYTSNLLREIGEAWDVAAATYDVPTFFRATMPFIYSKDFYEENLPWLRQREQLFQTVLTPEWFDGFRRALKSTQNFDVRGKLGAIKVPTLLISADQDIITPLSYQEEIRREIPHASWVVIKGAGHAVMYEKPREFSALVLGFLRTVGHHMVIP